MSNKQLSRYIQEQRQQGFSDEEIQEALKAAGWQDSQIAEAFAKSKPAAKGNKTSVKIKPLYLIIALVALALAVGAYFYGPTLIDMFDNADTEESGNQQGKSNADDNAKAGNSSADGEQPDSFDFSWKDKIEKVPDEENMFFALQDINLHTLKEGLWIDGLDAGRVPDGEGLERVSYDTLMHYLRGGKWNQETVDIVLNNRQPMIEAVYGVIDRRYMQPPEVLKYPVYDIDRTMGGEVLKWRQAFFLVALDAMSQVKNGDIDQGLENILAITDAGHRMMNSEQGTYIYIIASETRATGLTALRTVMRQNNLSKDQLENIKNKLESYAGNESGTQTVKSAFNFIAGIMDYNLSIKNAKEYWEKWVQPYRDDFDSWEDGADKFKEEYQETVEAWHDPSVYNIPEIKNKMQEAGTQIILAYRKGFGPFINQVQETTKEWAEMNEYENHNLGEKGTGILEEFLRYEIFILQKQFLNDLQVRALATIAGLKLYEKTNGSLPDDLDALYPDYMDVEPIDPINDDGGYFDYHKDDRVIYSALKDFQESRGEYIYTFADIGLEVAYWDYLYVLEDDNQVLQNKRYRFDLLNKLYNSHNQAPADFISDNSVSPYGSGRIGYATAEKGETEVYVCASDSVQAKQIGVEYLERTNGGPFILLREEDYDKIDLQKQTDKYYVFVSSEVEEEFDYSVESLRVYKCSFFKDIDWAAKPSAYEPASSVYIAQVGSVPVGRDQIIEATAHLWQHYYSIEENNTTIIQSELTDSGSMYEYRMEQASLRRGDPDKLEKDTVKVMDIIFTVDKQNGNVRVSHENINSFEGRYAEEERSYLNLW